MLSIAIKSAAWSNTKFIRGLDDIVVLKQQPGKDIYLVGGARTTASLINADLVDELRMIVYPLIAGEGKSLFATATRQHGLELNNVQQLSEGRVNLVYQLRRYSRFNRARKPQALGDRDDFLRGMVALRLQSKAMAIESANLEENQAFERLAEPFRQEIKLHCYRMLGSLHEAEDAMQETYLRAWRSFSSFEAGSSDERGSFRAWLYKIATNACLNALEGRKHQQRYLPDQLGPAGPPKLEGGPALDVPWLEPYPDIGLEGFADAAPSPEARYTAQESVQLAFVTAIQQLPPRQRAALMLCDVLGWASAEAANLLDGSTASINSALQRARATLSNRYSDRRPPLESQPTPAQQKLLGRYLRAWEGHDVDGFVAVLREDATAVMPPWLQWFIGREVIGTFFAAAWKACEGLHLVQTSANGQPAFAVYEFSGADKRWNAHSIHVLTLENDAISAITLFLDPGLFRGFGLPQFLPDDASSGMQNPSHHA